MQKLLVRFCLRNLDNNRGSALVIAIVFAVIIAIGGMGYIIITTNSLNKDSDAYQNDKSLHAAESGALLACKWLMQTKKENWVAHWPSSDFQNVAINGMYVTVTITVTGNQAEVRSSAFTSNTIKNATTFKKRIVATVRN